MARLSAFLTLGRFSRMVNTPARRLKGENRMADARAAS